MKILRNLAALLLALLLCTALTSAEGYKRVGDSMEDFTAVLCDGTEVTLSQLLETRDAVLINFWATWCPPCCQEFPVMQAAYDLYSDRVAVVALSVEPGDTAEVISAFKEQNGLATLPMGHDDNNLARLFDFDAIPTSVLVDRYGVICWMDSGAILEQLIFENMFADFTDINYTESQVGYEENELVLPTVTVDCAEMSAAANVEGGSLAFTVEDNRYAWPFLPAENGIVPANLGVNNSIACINTTVSARAGEVFSFQYIINTEAASDWLCVMVDEEIVGTRSGAAGEGVFAYAFEADGEYEISVGFSKDNARSVPDETVILRNFAVLSGPEAQAALAAVPTAVRSLPGKEYELSVYEENARKIEISVGGIPFARVFGDIPMYVIESDSARFKVKLGEEIDPYLALFYGDDDYFMQNFTTAVDCDGEGYIFETSLGRVEDGGYSNTYVTFHPQEQLEDGVMLIIFANEENVNFFCKVELANYGLTRVAWTYEDGTKPSTDKTAELDLKRFLPEAEGGDGLAAYTVIALDQNGDPVPGVLVQVCDEEVCEVVVTEADGMVMLDKPPYPYEIHVLMTPEGYSFDTAQTFTLNAEGDMLVLTLTKE